MTDPKPFQDDLELLDAYLSDRPRSCADVALVSCFAGDA